jgi:hypothetical protein
MVFDRWKISAGFAMIVTRNFSRTGTSIHSPCPSKPVVSYYHSKDRPNTHNVALLRANNHTFTDNFARSFILNRHRKHEPQLDECLWPQKTFGSNQNSGPADVFRLSFGPSRARGLTIADRNVNCETFCPI